MSRQNTSRYTRAITRRWSCDWSHTRKLRLRWTRKRSKLIMLYYFSILIHFCYRRQYRQTVQRLESRLNVTQQQLGAARKLPSLSDLSQSHEQCRQLSQTNSRLREENSDLREEVEELRAMVALLRGHGLVHSPRSSPILSSPTLSFLHSSQ